jgi:adenosine deaminase
MPREMVGAVSRIQKYLFHKIATKRIAIETCPTSNYMIGYFDKYIDLPLFTFMEQLPDNAISINTDDKGIIATSVENEYALVSAVMEKSRKYKGKANEVIERVVKDARKSRFNVP